MILKDRIDKILVERKIVKNRNEALGLIMSGNVFIEAKKIDKPGYQVLKNSNIVVKKSKNGKWVSRGGYKLDKAINHFNLDCKNIVALDIGCSTGGFTDVLLKKGAKKIYSVDVGYGQLDWKIRNNEKVVVHEKTNARYLDDKIIKEKLDAIVCDVSFISLKKALPASLFFLKNKGWIIGLIKPQFEIGKSLVGKGGVVRNEEHHEMVVSDIKDWLKKEKRLIVQGVVESPILGPKGNKEFLILAFNS